MEIARALTKRYKPHEGPSPSLSSSSDKQNGITSPNRAISSRRPHKDSNASSSAINRAKISLPIELISTTNVLAYNAPDIYPQQQQQQQQRDQVSSPSVSIPESVPSTASSSASTRSYDDSSSDRDGSTTGTNLTAASSVTTTPDCSREGSPAATFHEKHQPSHQLREYFNRGLMSPVSAVASPIDKPDRPDFDNNKKQQQEPKPESLSKLVTKDIPIVVDQLPTPQSPAPLVPTRALSHTKKTHQALARRRSRSRTSDPAHANASASEPSSSNSSGSSRDQQACAPPPLSPTTTVSTMNSSTLSLPTSSSSVPAAPTSNNSSANATSTTTSSSTTTTTTTTTGHRTSQDMFSNRVANSAHPFGAELAQVKELAEEFGVKDVRVWTDEEQFLQDNGLCKFGVEDYLSEIRPLFAGVFTDDVTLAAEGLYDRFGDAAVLASPTSIGSGYYGGPVGSQGPSKREKERGRERARTADGPAQNDGRDRAAECFAGGTAWF